MTPEEATIKINESVPGAKVTRIWGPKRRGRNRGALVVYVVLPNTHEDEQREMLSAALGEMNLDPENYYNGGVCRLFSSEEKAFKVAVEEFVESALDPIMKRGMNYFLDVRAGVDDRKVAVQIVSPAFNSNAAGSALQNKLEEIRPEIRKIAPGRRIYFYTSSGLRSVRRPTHTYAAAHHEDFDDDDDHSPNWPSKTGNPSGKGRDNNPPKR